MNTTPASRRQYPNIFQEKGESLMVPFRRSDWDNNGCHIQTKRLNFQIVKSFIDADGINTLTGKPHPAITIAEEYLSNPHETRTQCAERLHISRNQLGRYLRAARNISTDYEAKMYQKDGIASRPDASAFLLLY